MLARLQIAKNDKIYYHVHHLSEGVRISNIFYVENKGFEMRYWVISYVRILLLRRECSILESLNKMYFKSFIYFLWWTVCNMSNWHKTMKNIFSLFQLDFPNHYTAILSVSVMLCEYSISRFLRTDFFISLNLTVVLSTDKTLHLKRKFFKQTGFIYFVEYNF